MVLLSKKSKYSCKGQQGKSEITDKNHLSGDCEERKGACDF